MKIENIYDKHLQAIEEAEMKVRVAKRNLKEAERELDETLALVESELNEDSISTDHYGIRITTNSSSDRKPLWARKLSPEGNMLLDHGDIVEFKNEKAARRSDEYLWLEDNAEELGWEYEIVRAAN